jgi:hypothetical protein
MCRIRTGVVVVALSVVFANAVDRVRFRRVHRTSTVA